MNKRLRQQLRATEMVWRGYSCGGYTVESWKRILRTGREILRELDRKKAKRGSKA